MKKALLVGIKDYPGTFNDLMGCLNDVKSMAEILTSLFGFKAQDISLLTNSEATTANILKALEKLVKGTKAGDTLFFHYSGHGSQLPDTQGEESDRLDECLCPCDFDWENKAIRDDDLARIFGTLDPGAHLEVILDSCHSGTGLRGMDRYSKPRFLPLPAQMVPAGCSAKQCRPIKPQRAQVL